MESAKTNWKNNNLIPESMTGPREKQPTHFSPQPKSGCVNGSEAICQSPEQRRITFSGGDGSEKMWLNSPANDSHSAIEISPAPLAAMDGACQANRLANTSSNISETERLHETVSENENGNSSFSNPVPYYRPVVLPGRILSPFSPVHARQTEWPADKKPVEEPR
eukprot:Filipodium_phascolosomae@DN1159_c0_g1_i2.p2